jgi:hypothetical protein
MADVLAIFVHRQWTASPQVQAGSAYWRSGTSQECSSAVHSDTPAGPQVVHIAIHKHVLTILDTGPSFAKQESPGSGPHVASGEGRRTARSGASGRSSRRSGARGPRLCRRSRPHHHPRAGRRAGAGSLLGAPAAPAEDFSSAVSSTPRTYGQCNLSCLRPAASQHPGWRHQPGGPIGSPSPDFWGSAPDF